MRTIEVILKWISVERLSNANPVQPENRVEEKALLELKEAIQTTNFIAPIIVSSEGSFLTPLDGHRRLAVARALEITEVQCIVLPADVLTPQELFVLLNRGVKKISSKDWFWIWATSDGTLKEKLPSAIAFQIDDAVQFVGQQEAVKYGKERVIAPGQFADIRNLMKELASFDFPQDIEGRRRVTAWVIKHRQMREIREPADLKARRKTSDANKYLSRIHQCILADIPVYDKERGIFSRPGSHKIVKAFKKKAAAG